MLSLKWITFFFAATGLKLLKFPGNPASQSRSVMSILDGLDQKQTDSLLSVAALYRDNNQRLAAQATTIEAQASIIAAKDSYICAQEKLIARQDVKLEYQQDIIVNMTATIAEQHGTIAAQGEILDDFMAGREYRKKAGAEEEKAAQRYEALRKAA